MIGDIVEFKDKKFKEICRKKYKYFLFKLMNTNFIYYEDKSNGTERFFVEIGVKK